MKSRRLALGATSLTPYVLNVGRNIFAKGLLLLELNVVTVHMDPISFAVVNGITFLYQIGAPALSSSHWTIATRFWGRSLTQRTGSAVRILRRLEPQLIAVNSVAVGAVFVTLAIAFPQAAKWALLAFAVVQAFANVCNRQWLLLAEQRIAVLGTLQIIIALARLCAVLLLGQRISLESYLLTIAGAQIALALGTLLLSRYPISFGFRIDPQLSLPTSRVAISNLFTAVYTHADLVMLTALFRDSQAGFYAAAYRIYAIFAHLRISVLELVFPFLTTLRVGEVHSWVLRFQVLGAVLALAFTIVAKLLSELLVVLILGPAYQQAHEVLPILLLVAGLLWANLGLGYGLVAVDRERVLTWVMGGAAILNVGLNFALIPSYSIFGAAWATVAAESLIYLTAAIAHGPKHGVLAVLVLCALSLAYFATPVLNWRG